MSTARAFRLAPLVLGPILASLALAPPAGADAPPPPQALQYGREQARRGLAHVKARRWEEGRQALREAVAAKETAVLRYYLGLCEAGLDNLREAHRQLSRALELAKSPGGTGESAGVRRQVVEDATPLLDDVDARLPRITVRWPGAPPAGASLGVDGDAVTIADATTLLRLDPGEHELVASAPGKKRSATPFRLEERQNLELALALEDDAPAALPAPQPTVASALPERPPAAWQRPAGYAGLGLGAALIGAGVFSSLRVGVLERRFDNDAGLLAYRELAPAGQGTCDLAESGYEAPPGGGASSASRVRGVCDGARRVVTLQYVFYGAGAAFAAAGAYFTFLAPRAGATAPSASSWRVTPAAGPSGLSATWVMTF